MDSSKKKGGKPQSKNLPTTTPSGSKTPSGSLPQIAVKLQMDDDVTEPIAQGKDQAPMTIFKRVTMDPNTKLVASIKDMGMAKNVLQSSTMFPKLKDTGVKQFDANEHALLDQFWRSVGVALRSPFSGYFMNPVDLLECGINKGDSFVNLYTHAAMLCAGKMSRELSKITYGELPNYFDDLPCLTDMVNDNDLDAVISSDDIDTILSNEIALLRAACQAVIRDDDINVTSDFPQLVLLRVKRYPAADTLLNELGLGLSAACKIVQYVFPISPSTPPVIKFHTNVLATWFSNADDPWCDLGINVYAIGWITRILDSHQARRVLTSEMLNEKYNQLQTKISYEKYGGKLSEWFMAVQTLIAEFAALVQTSETHAAANGDSKSNILDGDNTVVGCTLKILGGRVFKHFQDKLYTSFGAEYEKVYLQLVRSASPVGPGTN